ncbi:hypothetical protein N9L02_03540, partial [Gammaproteobacteria bacterium]|nr:hypothetical protein [Gammaproteobacteria bacterium]
MKQFYNFCKSYFISIILLTFISIIIWLKGQELYWHNNALLPTDDQKLCLIFFLWIAWILKLIFIDSVANSYTTKTSQLPPDAKKKIESLRGRFEGAVSFLTKTFINKKGKDVNLLDLPWLLFIGPKGSGKSSILNKSNINFILSKNIKSKKTKIISQPEMCDWWITKDLVLVDIPGSYLSSKTKNSPEV